MVDVVIAARRRKQLSISLSCECAPAGVEALATAFQKLCILIQLGYISGVVAVNVIVVQHNSVYIYLLSGRYLDLCFSRALNL